MRRTVSLALASALAVFPAIDGRAQLPGAKFPPPAGAKPVFVPKKPGDRPKPPKPVWQEFPLNPKATLFLDFTESSADAVLSIFSRTSGITILRDPSFKLPLTVTSAKAVSLDKAFGILDTVLGFNGYQLQKKGDLLVVGKIPPPQQTFSAPPPQPVPEIRTYALANANAGQVARVLNEIFAAAPAAPAGGNPSFPPGMMMGAAVPAPEVAGRRAPSRRARRTTATRSSSTPCPRTRRRPRR